MPIYEFSCQKCGDDFEALCRMGGTADDGCPACGSQRIAKRMSTFVGKSGNGRGRMETTPCGKPATPASPCAGGRCACH